MAISSAGIGSGLDVSGIISQLMALEQRPLTALASKEAKYQAQLSAYGSLKGALSTFQGALSSLNDPKKFTAVNGSVADATIASAVVTSAATPGNYSIEVQKLAQAQKLKSEAFAATSTAIGTGTLTISFGTYDADTFTANPDKPSKEITIAAGDNSLAGIRDAINAADAGVSAAIINDGTGNRLTISSKDSGTANALRISVTDDDGTHTDTAGLSQLAFDARSVSGVTNLTQTVAAVDAVVVIDGITVTKSSNSISDALEGVTLNLAKTNVGSSTTLTIARDTGGVQNSIQSFVKAYNDLNKTITELTKYDATTKKGSTLTGESTVRTLQAQLRGLFNTPLSIASGGLTTLSEVGISFQLDGTLKLDSTKLTAALNDPSKDVSTLFAQVAKPTGSLVSLVGTTAGTQAGTYAVSVSQMPTQGTSVGSVTPTGNDLKIVAGADDNLVLEVDGVSVSITLAAGNYTAATLAAEIQTKINDASDLKSAGISVTVTESGGPLTVTSASYGSVSRVSISGGNGSTAIFGTPVETAGTDIAGTIGGVAATGSGYTLTGTGAASGLAIKIDGGATGDRGVVSFGQGYAYQLDKLISRMLEPDSLIDGRLEGISSSIDDIGDRREAMALRLESTEKRLRAQFTALDTLMSRMQQTSSFLSQQLANLPTYE